MRWDRRKRTVWDVGNRRPFRLSKDGCRDLLHALVACDGRIHDTFSLDVRDGEIRYAMKPHECAVLFRISLPEGAEDAFRVIMGRDSLEEPPLVTTA